MSYTIWKFFEKFAYREKRQRPHDADKTSGFTASVHITYREAGSEVVRTADLMNLLWRVKLRSQLLAEFDSEDKNLLIENNLRRSREQQKLHDL